MQESRSFRGVLSSALRAATLLSVLASSRLGAQDLGFQGPSYTGANSFPSGTKPESKLWFNDGAWWGSLWSASALSYSIHRLDPVTQVWSDTGVQIDGRPISRSDCLWNGTKLYVASHRWNPGGGNAGHPLVVYRYAYDPVAEQYSRDAGFPVQIADSSAETAVIDQDSTGTLWAVWMRDLRLRVTHTVGGDDRSWVAPFIHPQNGNSVTIDDVGSVVHFGGDKIGVMWADQSTFTYWFSYHVDGDPDMAWSTAVPLLAGTGDDHINLKAASDGRLFAVLKTSTNEIHLGVRATNGTWTTHRISDAAAGWTRPICVLDETADEIHVFATSPVIAGTIYEKVSPMGAIAFAGGIGTPVIFDAEDPSHNDSTSSKQAANRDTGLVVVASHQPTERYWHHRDDLGGPVAAAPVAAASADPRSGFTTLPVQFTDRSSHAPTSWFWTFGDGTNSTQQHPQHTYFAPGTYDVTLTVTNALGDDTVEELDWITVSPAPLALTLHALEDTQLNSGSPDNSYGALNEMRIRNPNFRSLVKFLVPASTNEIVSARLRLFANDGGPDAGSVFATASGWQEPFVTWNTAPTGGTLIGSLGAVADNAWVELDVTSAVTTSGVVAFGITTSSTNSVFYSTREGANAPELVLTLENHTPPPIASFTADLTSGTVPFPVQFTDTTTNGPTSWSWSFGDGGGSAEQNPAHEYTVPGTYTVSLTASNEGGSDVETVTNYVHALPPAPVASFTADVTSGVAPLSVQFSDTSSPDATTWSWDFGDGNGSSEQDPLHVYTTPGVYTVSLTASNEGGSDVETVADYVVVFSGAPIASFEANPRRGPAPLSVEFTDTSAFTPTSWLWSFGDGTFSTAHNPKHVYDQIGTYTVTLTATNALGSDQVQGSVRAGRPTLAPHAPPP